MFFLYTFWFPDLQHTQVPKWQNKKKKKLYNNSMKTFKFLSKKNK